MINVDNAWPTPHRVRNAGKKAVGSCIDPFLEDEDVVLVLLLVSTRAYENGRVSEGQE